MEIFFNLMMLSFILDLKSDNDFVVFKICHYAYSRDDIACPRDDIANLVKK